jgi:hypothetical protein
MADARQVHQAEVAAINDQALLGLATTQQLLRELSVRGEVSALVETDPQPALWLQAAAEGMLQILPEHLLNYRTVDEPMMTSGRIADLILKHLSSEWVSASDLRRKMAYRDRDAFADAIDGLVSEGLAEQRSARDGGKSYRRVRPVTSIRFARDVV